MAPRKKVTADMDISCALSLDPSTLVVLWTEGIKEAITGGGRRS